MIENSANLVYLEEYLFGGSAHKILPKTTESEFTSFAQIIISLDSLKKAIQSHTCDDGFCIINHISSLADEASNISEILKNLQEMNSLFVSELTTIQKLEILIDTLKHGTSSLINSNLKIETSCRCGKFSGNKPLQYKIFFEFSLNQFIDPLPDYYSEFVFFKGLCAKVNTSVLFPKQNTFIQAFLGQNSKNFRQNSHFQSFCSCGKLNSIDFVAKNYPDLLVF